MAMVKPRVIPSPDLADCPDNAATIPTLIGSAARTDAARDPNRADTATHQKLTVRTARARTISSPLPGSSRHDVECRERNTLSPAQQLAAPVTLLPPTVGDATLWWQRCAAEFGACAPLLAFCALSHWERAGVREAQPLDHALPPSP